MSEFSNQILCINCPRIILRQNSSNSPKVYQGSGSITRKSERNLELELSYFNDDSWSSMLKHFESLGEKGRIIEARAESLESELFTLSVAVESLLTMDNLQEYFLSKNPNNIESQISLLKDCMKELELEDSFIKKLEGCMNSMKKLSATDKLKKLVDKGLVDKSLTKSWKKIRNKAAHGCILETS
ncbi:MAG: hypothetical protein AAF915_01385 [Cyanobacteria bacterium P01_D01_bin.50]